MRLLKQKNRKILFSLLIFLLIKCSNEKNVKEFKLEQISETERIKKEKIILNNTADSLNAQIESLNTQKTKLSDSLNSYDDINYIIKNSYLDHVILGNKNISNISAFFENLGFLLKKGKLHKIGLTNNFVEFSDNSEIELMEVTNPTENLSKEYNKLISENNFGLQFALRVVDIDKLKSSFEKVNSNFTEIQKNSDFSLLSGSKMNAELPIFFIQFKKLNNSIINHPNKVKGISSVWFETKDIKKSAGQLVDLGFEPFGNFVIPTFSRKIVEFKNNNFSIILIESNKYGITGLSLITDKNNELMKIINNNFDKSFTDKIITKQNSVFLPKEITKSVWLEFSEK